MSSIILDGRNQTISGEHYTGSLYARMAHSDGRPYHTFRTASVLVTGREITFEDCVFENTAGPGDRVGQAIALYVDGDGIRLKNCVLSGHQDTLFLAPLPEKEREKDGFLGPGEFLPRTPRTVWFEDCLIEGSVDFIFGGATAYFDRCEFRSLEPGYVFAPSTPKGVKEGFVARDCFFTTAGMNYEAEGLTRLRRWEENELPEEWNASAVPREKSSVPDGSCYLGRPWREYGAVRLEHCWLGRHIAPEGWKDWADAGKNGTARFAEIRSCGPGADPARRVSWAEAI